MPTAVGACGGATGRSAPGTGGWAALMGRCGSSWPDGADAEAGLSGARRPAAGVLLVARRLLLQVGGPLDQAGGRVGRAGDFRLNIACPIYATSMIL
jgi:hypothetical protein